MPVMGITDHPNYENINNNVMTEISNKIQIGIDKGFTKTPKIEDKTGIPREANPLNEINTGGAIDIKV